MTLIPEAQRCTLKRCHSLFSHCQCWHGPISDPQFDSLVAEPPASTGARSRLNLRQFGATLSWLSSFTLWIAANCLGCSRILGLAFGSILVLVLGGVASSARAAAFNWTNAIPGNYNVSTSWSPNGLPGAADTATVGNSTRPNGSVLYTNATNVYALNLLQLGQASGASGTFTMSAGALSITNNSGTGLSVGTSSGGTGNFNLNGGTLTVQREGAGETYYRDVFIMGPTAGATGTFTLNGGTVLCLGGIEIGFGGVGTITVNDGTLIDNGWFGLGRGNNGTGWGTFNLTGGTVYLLRNPATDSGANGISFCQVGTNGTVNISGGTLYCYLIRMHDGPGSAYTDWETLNVSGGDLYLGAGGVFDSGGAGTHNTSIALSGGTFHTLNLGANTGGTQGTNSVLSGGTNWAWSGSLPATLATSPGSGTVTFAPETGRSITLNAPFSGAGNLTVAGLGTVALGAVNTYTGDTTISQGTLALVGTGGIASSRIIVAGGATIDASGLSSAFTLSSGQMLTNSSSTPTLNGDINIGQGTASLLYSPGTPSFIVTAGALTLATNSVLQINNTGAALAPQRYKLISAGPGGVVSGVGLPIPTVGGGGVTSGQYVSLAVSGNELYLVVTNDRPPAIANTVSNSVLIGATWKIAISNLATLAGWSDPDGDPVSFQSAGPLSANGTNVTSDNVNIYYNGPLASDDYVPYTITDGKLNASGLIYLHAMNATAVVPSETNHVISLNGPWRFYFERLASYWSGSVPNISIVDSSQPFQQLNYIEGTGWTNLGVPGNWEMAGFSPCTYYGPDTTSGLYRYWFQIPASLQGRQIYLSLDGVQTSAEVWVNGQPAAVNEPSWGLSNFHDSGWTAFQVNVTPQVNFGTSNLLAIRVVKQSPSVDLDTGDYFTLGGIYRPVTLYSVPQTNIADVQVQTHLLPNNQAEVDVSADVTQGNSSTPVSMILNGVETVTNATNGKATFTQIINQPRLWSAEFPNLYDLVLRVKDATGAITETVSNRVGIREITISNAVVLLNGVPVKLAGVCNHDSWATNGNALGPDNWRTDILMMKAANINAIRTTHYNFGSGFFDLCDELGMYVADELPYCWVSSVGDTGMTPAFTQRAREVIRRDRNHPCVLIWAVGNENSAGANLQTTADLVKSLDSTRPRLVSTFPGSKYNVELSDRHYPSPSTMASDGAAATVYPYVYMEQPNTWDVRLAADASVSERWGIAQQRVWNVCLQYDTIVGTFPFEWSDRAVADPNSDASYTQYQSTGVQLLYSFPSGIHLLKCKGMVDGFRNPRPKVYEARMVYSPIQVGNGLTVSSGQASFSVTNIYSFTDLAYLTMAWKLERSGLTIASGNANASVPPRNHGTVQITLPADALGYADTLQVDFMHPDGRDIVAHQWTLTNTVAPFQFLTNLPVGLPIPTFNLITRQEVSDPGLWTKTVRYPASLSSVALTPPNATNLAQLQALSATVIGGTTGTQVLGQVQAGYTNNQFSYTLTWSGSSWEVQEVGWTFQMPSTCDHFSWNRAAPWTVYPWYAIGRAAGTATPDSTNVDITRVDIPNAFDFNSTKYDCNWACLTTTAGAGLMAQFNPAQRFQCRAGGGNGGSYVLYVNQVVSLPNDFTSSVVPDLLLTLNSGNILQGSFVIGSATTALTNAIAAVSHLAANFSNAGGSNQLRVSFNGLSSTNYSVWASSNLMQWQWAGSATEVSSGSYQFLDPASATAPNRFYRISSP
jgi:autotransporter-associated beta strand protein